MPDTMIPVEAPAIQRRSLEIKNLAAALVKAQAAMEGARKDKNNPHFKTAYADIAAVWDAIREPLTANGLAIVQFPRTNANGVEVETILLHTSGEFMSADPLWLPATMTAQGVGSAITYGRRYALMAVAGVAPVDDDGNAAIARNGSVQMSNPRDFIDDAVADGLVKNGDTRSTHEQTYVPVGKRPENVERTKKRVDAAIGTFALSGQSVESLDKFWESNAKEFSWIEKHIPAEYERLEKAYNGARDAASARNPMQAG